MVDDDVDSLICNTSQIRDEEEKDMSKSEINSSGSESFSSSSSSEKPDTNYIEDEIALHTIRTKPSKASLFCSVPLNRIGAVLGYNSHKIDAADTSGMKIKQTSRKLLCLYCDRTFVSSNLRQKHVERCHSEKQNRRLSSRKLQSQFTTTACCYCDKLPVEHSLRQLFNHLISDHSEKYFGCLSCEERFLNQSHLNDHNAKVHCDFSMKSRQKTSPSVEIQKDAEKTDSNGISDQIVDDSKETYQKLTRSMAKDKDSQPIKPSLRQLRNKKIAIKASKIGLKRSKRLQAAQAKVPVRKKRTSTFDGVKAEETTSKPPEKTKNPSVNPYPEFDNYYRVKKITDHSIDNLKISSLTFDDVFDKAFFSRIKCNIQENLMYHLDGKLFKNEESESRISNFEKNPPAQDVPSTSSENFGCDLTLNALTPVTSILTPHFGEDLESQIEYGSKPSKKKLQPRQDPVRHKYVTRRKYQASILEHKENRDLSKLDMWTQLVIKDRQQKVMNDQKSAKEMLEYTTCEEYKLKVQRNELNRILDRRGPFEDLREEASKKAALDNLNSESANQITEECFKEVRSLMDDLLNEIVKVSLDSGENSENSVKLEEEENFLDKVDIPEFPEYLKLSRKTSVLNEEEIDKSDKIALICSSQETENYELPTNKVRAKNEMVELSGEWARSRIYVCAACGLKLPNMKILLEHKTLDHQYAWVQHYEFVGNQSKLYRHLCIPGLGKVGHVEDTVQCKLWRRSEARVCTKCGKICNTLGELHRHILECGGDWTWMLARKKCKYRPFGSRKKRRGLVKRIRERNQKTEQTEKKEYKKRFEGPRQRPSDADTIQRMLANLPPKRSSRKSICMKDGFPRNLNKNQNSKKQVMKCGKIVMKKSTYNLSESKEPKRETNHKRTLRSLNRTLSSKILDTTNKLRVKRQLMKNIRRSTRKTTMSGPCEDQKVIIEDEDSKEYNANIVKAGKVRSENGKNRIKNILQEKINIKSFFPVSKRKLTKNNKINNVCEPPQYSDNSKEKTVSEGKKSKTSIKKLLKKSFNFKKKAAPGSDSVNQLKVSSEPVVVIEKLQQSEQKMTKPTSAPPSALSSKRKLRSSFRKVIDKVKKLKIDNSSSFSSGQNKSATVKPSNSFLGQGTKEKEKLPTILVPLVEEPKENPPSTPAFVQNVIDSNSPTEESLIPENIFNLEHNSENLLQAKSPLENSLNELRNNEAKNAFETAAVKECAVVTDTKPEIMTESKTVSVLATNSAPNVSSQATTPKEMSFLSIETSVKSDKSPLLSPVLSPSALSPKLKGRLRKPNRGLNDCIAMLTKKAFEVKTCSSDSSTNENCLKLQENKPIADNKNIAHKFVRPNECILKIPVFEAESNKNVQSEVLDLSKPKQKIEEGMKSSNEDAIALSSLKTPFWEHNTEVNHSILVRNRNAAPTANLADLWQPMLHTLQKIIPNSISEKPILKIPKIVETSWSTVDDIIQRVVENRCESSITKSAIEIEKLPLKIPSVAVTNSVDKIIEEVVKGNIGYSPKNCNINNTKGLEHLENVQKESKLLNSTTRRKSSKLNKKDKVCSINIEDKSISVTTSNTLNRLNKNGNNALENINKLNISVVASPSTKHTIISDSKASNLEQEEIVSFNSISNSEAKKEDCALLETMAPIEAQATEISNKATISTDSSKIGQLDCKQVLQTDLLLEVALCKKDEGSVGKVNETSMKLKDSTKVEKNFKMNSGKENYCAYISDNTDLIETNSIQDTEEVAEILSSTENVSESLSDKNIDAIESSLQISDYQHAEIRPLIMNVNIGEATEDVSNNLSLRRCLHENKHIINQCEDGKQSDIYSIIEDEPIILEEKAVFEDPKTSPSTDSEDDLPLVILKEKSKNISTTLSRRNNNTCKSLERKPINFHTRLESISELSELYSGSTKQITSKFPLHVVKESSTSQSKDEEATEHISDEFEEDNIGGLEKKIDRRRSTRKNSSTEKSPCSPTKEMKKTKSKCGKSNCTKKRLVSDLKTEIADGNYNGNISKKLTEETFNDQKLIHFTKNDISDDFMATEVLSEEHITSEKALNLKSEKESKIINSTEDVKSEIETTSKSDVAENFIPKLKINKMKFPNKDKFKNRTAKSKLIFKFPKIVLKEPTLKLPFFEPGFKKELKKAKNEELVDEVNAINERKMNHVKDLASSEELIKEPEFTGIKLKIKTKVKKKDKYKKDLLSSIGNPDKTGTFSSELDEVSVGLTGVSKVSHGDPKINGDLLISTAKKVSNEISEFPFDNSSKKESKISSVRNTVFSSKIKSMNQCKQKNFDKKKKSEKAEVNNSSLCPDQPVSSKKKDEDLLIDCIANNTSPVNQDKHVESSTTEFNILSSGESIDNINVKVSNHKNKVSKKAKKHKVKANDPKFQFSSDLSKSESIDISSTVKSHPPRSNQCETSLVNNTEIYCDIYSNESPQEYKAVIDTNESDIHYSNSTSKSNVNEKPTKHSETEFDVREHDRFDSITELYPFSQMDVGKTKNISMQTVVNEEDESSDLIPVRSLRSTVKILYKQSNIFELEVQNRENIDLKMKDNSKCTSTENIQGTSHSSEFKSSNQHHEEIAIEQGEPILGEIKHCTFKKNNSALPDITVSLSNTQNDKQLNHTVNINRQKKNKRTREREIEVQTRKISSKEFQPANTNLDLDLGSSAQVSKSECVGSNGINLRPISTLENCLAETLQNTSIDNDISTRIEDIKEKTNVVNASPVEDDIVLFAEKGLSSQNETAKNPNVAELHPIINPAYSQTKINLTKRLSEKYKKALQKKLNKSIASDMEATELDDISLAKLQALSHRGFNSENELKDSTKNDILVSHKKSKSKKGNIKSKSLRTSDDDLYKFEMNISKNKEKEIQLTEVKSLVNESTDSNIEKQLLSNLDLCGRKSEEDMAIEVKECNDILVNEETYSIKNLDNMDTRKCALDTSKNQSHSLDHPKQISDVLETKENSISNIAICSKFISAQNAKHQETDLKNILYTTVLPEDAFADEQIGVSPDSPIANKVEYSIDCKSVDANSIRRSRTAKDKALENINTLEKNFDKDGILEAENSENVVSPKKKKSPKLAGSGKHVTSAESKIESEFTTPRRSRTAKAKALENICKFEKVANTSDIKDSNTDDVVKILNSSKLLSSNSNDELLLSSCYEKSAINSLQLIETHNDISNEFMDTSAIGVVTENVDIRNKQNNKYFSTAFDYRVNAAIKNENVRIAEKESSNIDDMQSNMKGKAILNFSDNLMTSDHVVEVKPDIIVGIDGHDICAESVAKDDILLEKNNLCVAMDDIENNLTFSEARKHENRAPVVEDITFNRKSRLAKSKALENIIELNMKTDNIDLEADIPETKMDKIEKNNKKYRSRKSDNSDLIDEKIYKELSEDLHGNDVSLKNSFLHNHHGKGAEESKEITDCYDISKIDEDYNLNQTNPIIFSPKKNKAIQSKVSHDKKSIYNTENSSTNEDKFNSNLADKSEEILIEIEAGNGSLAKKFVSQDGLTDSLQMSSVVEIAENEIMNEEPKEKRNKRNSIKKQNHKKSSQPVESLKLEEGLFDNEEVLSKSSEIKSEMEGSLKENKRHSNGENMEHPTINKIISDVCKEDDIIGSEIENKRSRRACKVNTYNENDLAEAIFMQASVQKEKEKSKKRKLDPNVQHTPTTMKINEKKHTKVSEKVMNSDELFDLLKATSAEIPTKLSKQTFSDAVDGVHENFNDDHFNDVFDDILRKSQALLGEKSKNLTSNKPAEMCRSTDTSDNTENFTDIAKTKSSSIKCSDYILEETKISGQSVSSQNDLCKSEESEDLFCDICKKSFKRIDNLVKHRTTLTHISKLSEIEAKQAEGKIKQSDQVMEDSSSLFNGTEIPKSSQVESLYSYPSTKGNDALKIAEIITNSFEKPNSHPDKNLSEIPPVSEYRRYKSLGERKSFESDQGSSNISDNIDNNIYESHIPNNAGVILEKQITLLQNIIENRGLDYIDDLSVSSYHSLENSNVRDSPVSGIYTKVDSSRNFIFPRNASKKTEPESFLRPLQVEDISEDSVNLKNSEDVKSRKVLNRDEELFLECCSLLKSGSEVSNFSKKSNRTVVNSVALKTSDEPDIFESKVLIDKMREESSDYSRIATPLGDSFGDTSNSNTVLSNWALSKEENIQEKAGNYFNFKENVSSNEKSFYSSKLNNSVSKSMENSFKDTSKIVKSRKHPSPLKLEEEMVDPDSSSKMPTKGALKVFEGLKVSISTVELNLEAVLNNSPPIKRTDSGNPENDMCEKQFSSPKTPRSSRKSKPVKNKQQLDDRFIFKVKKKPASKECEKANLDSIKEATDKISDVYDFEETQDNTDVFVKPDFKTFRTKGEELKNENIFENNYEGHTLSSSSSSTNSMCKKPKANECITKKKHMIMGRIFKNAVKPKVDEDIRDIPNIDHNELVENYVLSCTPKVDEEFKKPKMTEEEMNSLFDKLLDKPADTSKKQIVQNKLDLKSTGLKKKFKIRCKKRHRTNSDSTDDEFGLNRIVKKRPSRKNAKEENNSINLEQELKECIGVASRKSQRKCTSGKQNVLVEYWSSDESAFEAFLENHLEELSSRTDLLEQQNESHIQIETKIEEENQVAKISNSKIHSIEKETKLKSKKCTSNKKKGLGIESPNSAALSQPVSQINRRKRAAAHPLYHWSSSSEDETQDLIEVKSMRDDNDDEYDEDRPIQHGWIVGDSPKKLVTMLAQAKGKKTEPESSVKEQGKKKNSNS